MLPTDLKAEHFRAYPPEANALALRYFDLFRKMPLALLPSVLREIAAFDWMFPVERRELEDQLSHLSGLPSAPLNALFSGFARIQLSKNLERLDWVNSPELFVEELSAALWATHQMDSFRIAAEAYTEQVYKSVPEQKPVIPRLIIVAIGQGVSGQTSRQLFRKLRPYGVYFTNVAPNNGLTQLMAIVESRSRENPAPFRHWYIDGGKEAEHNANLTVVSYAALGSAREALVAKIHAEIGSGTSGPEALRTKMARLRPQELGLDSVGHTVLSHFNLRLLTENSGTQIFSTTFVQLAAKEALRRAQPLTLFARFAPRQTQRPMNELLSDQHQTVGVDPVGSLIDADMGAYYIWLNQRRLAGSDSSSFVAWFEEHNEALVIGPSLPAGTESSNLISLRDLVATTA